MAFAPYAGIGQNAQVMKAVAEEDGFCRERQATVSADEHALLVSLEMVEHSAVMAEAALTFWAGVAFCAPFVRLHVLLAFCHAGENALAEITLIELVLKVVCLQMMLQVILCSKVGCTNDAPDCGRLCMAAQVLTIVRQMAELLAAFSTVVETHTIMDVQMFMEEERRGKCEAAHLATMLF